MKPFVRSPAPAVWTEWESQWLRKLLDDSANAHACFEWQRDNVSAREVFHQRVRPETHPTLCAYCDGTLGEQSPRTIDHFLPASVFPVLGMSWGNLFPACVVCNSTMKGDKWSCQLVRPDEIKDGWFVFDPEEGDVDAKPELDRRTRARIRLTIRVFGLNATARRNARRRLWQRLDKLFKSGFDDEIELQAREGDYRFIADGFIPRAL